jgi:uncharacterized surface protein with fasciclin (FAS1) repeats
MKKSLSPLFAVVVALSIAACGEKKDTTPPATETPAPEPAPVVAAEPPAEPEKPAEPAPPPAPTKDILTTATDAGNFTTLLTAIDKAGLTETWKGPGPFTVFAPTDEAFAKLPKAELDKLLKNKKKLAEVLNYHVVAGNVKAADVAAMPTAKTVNGADLTIDATSGVKVNGATVISADIMTTNGVIHVIDTVLMPPKAGKPAAKKAAS